MMQGSAPPPAEMGPSPTPPAPATEQSCQERQALLLLADGTLLRGSAFGAIGTAIGEVVFNTGMSGYQEIITDPSYVGQLVTFTFPELGNTGVNEQDNESAGPSVRAVISRELAPVASNWRHTETLPDWLERHGVVGIRGLDTRALVRHLRDGGAINGAVSSDGTSPAALLQRVRQAPSMAGLNLASGVSTRATHHWREDPAAVFDARLRRGQGAPYHVVAVDFGIKRAILRRLASHGCNVTVVPADTDLAGVLCHDPEGVFLSNGPGDPAAVSSGVALARELIDTDLPIFGICLGHQILGLALGGTSFKLGFGHRGLNHPCGTAGQVEITSQNHGFALAADSLPAEVEVTHINLNDRTVAALRHREKPIFAVQYHPEASPGPHDADHHFSRFTALIEARRQRD